MLIACDNFKMLKMNLKIENYNCMLIFQQQYINILNLLHDNIQHDAII